MEIWFYRSLAKAGNWLPVNTEKHVEGNLIFAPLKHVKIWAKLKQRGLFHRLRYQ